MSIARHHAEWLSLVEASGPFLSLQVLMDAFPHGLDAHDADRFKVLRQAYEEWLDNRDTPGIHRAWVEWVLAEMLMFPDKVLVTGQGIPTGLQVTITEHQVTLRPDWVLVEPTTRKPRLLIQRVPPDQGLEKTLKGSRWKASPATGMMELLHATDIRLGLLTNGEQWMLVSAPKGESTGYISWYSNLWLEEKLTLRAFQSLLGVRRFFGVDPGETIEDLLAKSKDAQQEVTDQLGLQVRKAVEVLVQALDRIDQDRQRTLLRGLPETVLYQAALTVMMRLVFLFSAEERDLLLLGDPLYDQSYAVSTLRSQLRELADQCGEELLERRYDAWARLLATFRSVFGGLHHDALQLPAYGGELFDPDRFPFLEGRALATRWLETPAAPIPINNRTVLHLLEALQILQVKVPGGGAEPRKLSFRALDIEQIGHVYEGLLDHTAVRSTETILGLAGTKNKEPEVALGELERLRAKGTADLMAFLCKETGRSESALQKALPDLLPLEAKGEGTGGKSQVDWAALDMQQLRIACHNDPALFDRVLPWVKLIRLDTFDYPVVIPAGSVFVTQGVDRRDTYTHYTPRALTEEIVKYTLEPLVYIGVAEGWPKAKWKLKSAAALLQLKVCDMAMGSGAFLVQVCRYLSERLVEAWDMEAGPRPPKARGEQDTPPVPLSRPGRGARGEGNRSTGVEGEPPHPLTPSPTRGEGEPEGAVPPLSRSGRGAGGEGNRSRSGKKIRGEGQIRILPDGSLSRAKPSEMILPSDPDEQLAIARRIVADRCLYGVDKNPMAVEMAKLSLWLITLQKNRPFTFLDHALRSGDSLLGITLEQLRYWNLDISGTPELFTDRIRRDINEVIHLRQQIAAKPVITVQDQRTKASLLFQANARANDLRDGCNLLLSSYINPFKKDRQDSIRKLLLYAYRDGDDVPPDLADSLTMADQTPFHWELEFPEVFVDHDGFDAIVGNPPFQGGKKITGALGTTYRNFIVEWIAQGQRGNADLCAYFFLKAGHLIKAKGTLGLVATNTIAQGDTREVGLDQLVAQGYTIPRAIPSRPWPGTAALEVAYVWLHKGDWRQEFVLNDNPVEGITAYLTVPGKSVGKPYKLVANAGKSFQGSIVLGMGFVLEPEEAQALIAEDSKNKDVLFPYLNGQDLNSNPDQSPNRWVINFFDWPLDADHDDPKKPKGAPYAADYPDCLAILEEKVKPERLEKAKDVAAAPWWQFWRIRGELYGAISECDRVLFHGFTSKYVCFGFVPSKNIVYAGPHVVIALDRWSKFTLLQSTIYDTWVFANCSTHETRLRFAPSDIFETFPFPDLTDTLETIGEAYYSHRQTIMQTRQEGLTKTYNRFHDPNQTDPDIQTLRDLHIEMDNAVAAAYGWHDLLPSSTGGDGESPHPLTPSPTRGEGEPEDAVPPLSRPGRGAGGEGLLAGGEGSISTKGDRESPHPLTPSPTRGEGEPEEAVSPLSRPGRGAGGEGLLAGGEGSVSTRIEGEPPHPLTPSPTGGEGEPEGAVSPLSRPGRGAGGEGLLAGGEGLAHGFHDTKQGLRFTISEAARREILDRLLALNHQRHAAEEAQGLHQKKKAKSKSTKAKGGKSAKPAPGRDINPDLAQGELF